MKFQKKENPYKRCPRCGNKCLKIQEKCPECDLIFSRLQLATNKAAKKKLAHFDRDYVIFTKNLPSDVQWWKLLLYTIFLGWFGGHYYYVGKYIKGLFMSLGFVYLVVGTIFNAQIVAANATLLYLPIAIYALAWMVSFCYVASKKFKVPIYVDQTIVDQKAMQAREDYDRLSKEIAKEKNNVKKAKTSRSKKSGGNK